MARFYGPIGFQAEQVETDPGVFENVITEKSFSGTVIRNTVKQQEGENLNKDRSAGVSISIVGDEKSIDPLFAIIYLKWMGVLWTVSDVDASQRPRLLLRLGGVYNGPTPSDP